MQHGEEVSHDALAVGVGQSTFSIPHKHKNRNAFPAAWQFRPAVDVEDVERLDFRSLYIIQSFKYFAYRDVFIDDYRQIAANRRQSGDRFRDG